MKLYDVRLANWIDRQVLHHRVNAVCRHLWCFHVWPVCVEDDCDYHR